MDNKEGVSSKYYFLGVVIVLIIIFKMATGDDSYKPTNTNTFDYNNDKQIETILDRKPE